MIPLNTQEFAIVPAPTTQWLVLCCDSNRTLALATHLGGYGAWVPTWKVSKQLPRSSVRRKVTEACIPGVVFVPRVRYFELPRIVGFRHYWMRDAERNHICVPDRQLDALRSIADRPLVPASKLPRAGQIIKMPDGPWQGLRAKVVSASQRQLKVDVETQPQRFTQRVQFPPCLLSGD